jgi:HlyD family secretion protein
MTSKTTSTSPARRRAGNSRKFVPYAAGAALLALIVFGLMPKPPEVEVATVSTGPLTVSVLEEGKTRIRHRYVVSPPVAGFLRRVELRAGAPVEAGKTVLAVLESEPSSFLNPRALAQAEAAVKAAEATRDQREAAQERARSALALAKKEWERTDELRRKGAVSAREWDNAENQATVLARDLRSAEFALQTSEHELTQARAALLQVQSPSSEKSESLKILAPVNGFILSVTEESARIVTPGTQIMEVGDTNDLEAEIELLSSDAVGVQVGADVSIEQWGGAKPLRGKVSLVEPGGYTKISALGVEEQRVKVRVDFLDPLPPGTTFGDRYRVEARIVTWHGENVLQVPTGALFRRGGDWMAFAYAHGKARLTKVEIAHNNGIAAEVVSGLSHDQTVVLHPPDAVADGSSVRPRH